MATSPVDQVFGVAELLEMILLGLDPCTLLVAQRTCKAWKATIDASTPLQKALFFVASTPNLAYYHKEFETVFFPCSGATCTYCRLQWSLPHQGKLWMHPEYLLSIHRELEPAVDAAYRAETTSPHHLWQDIESTKLHCGQIRLNPALVAKLQWFLKLSAASESDPYQVPEASLGRDMDLPESARRPEASWRRMLLTDPPLAAPELREVCPSEYERCRFEVHGLGAGAITAQELREIVAGYSGKRIYIGGAHLFAIDLEDRISEIAVESEGAGRGG